MRAGFVRGGRRAPRRADERRRRWCASTWLDRRQADYEASTAPQRAWVRGRGPASRAISGRRTPRPVTRSSTRIPSRSCGAITGGGTCRASDALVAGGSQPATRARPSASSAETPIRQRRALELRGSTGDGFRAGVASARRGGQPRARSRSTGHTLGSPLRALRAASYTAARADHSKWCIVATDSGRRYIGESLVGVVTNQGHDLHHPGRPWRAALRPSAARAERAIAVGVPDRRVQRPRPDHQRDPARSRAGDARRRRPRTGATVVEGGTATGSSSARRSDAPLDSDLWAEEIFAPVAPVIAVDSEEAIWAVEFKPTNTYPIAVVTGDLARGRGWRSSCAGHGPRRLDLPRRGDVRRAPGACGSAGAGRRR